MAFLSYCHPTLYFLSGAIKLNQKLPLNNDNKITLFKIYWPHNKCPFIIYFPHLKLASQRSDKDDSLTPFSSVQSFLARHWWQSSQERGNISAQGHSFVPGHKLWGEQVLTHGPNHLSPFFTPQKKDGAVPLLLQRGNTAMGNYALRGTFVFPLSPLRTKCSWL